jgi:hypothetical protein
MRWPASSKSRARTPARVASAAAAGLEAIARQQDAGNPPHPAALEALERELGDGLSELDQLFSL